MSGVLRTQPLVGQARIRYVAACLDRVEVGKVGSDPAVKLRRVAGMAVAGDHHPDTRDAGEQAEALAVAAERVGRVQVEQRDLDIGEHVPGDQHPLVGEEDGTMAGRVGIVRVDERTRAQPVDLVAERRNGDFVRGLIEQGKVTASHDCADGGLLITLAEMAISGGIGATIDVAAEITGSLPAHAYFFGEDQARYVLTVAAADAGTVIAAAQAAGVPVTRLGVTGGDRLDLGKHGAVALSVLKATHEAFFPRLMSAAE